MLQSCTRLNPLSAVTHTLRSRWGSRSSGRRCVRLPHPTHTLRDWWRTMGCVHGLVNTHKRTNANVRPCVRVYASIPPPARVTMGLQHHSGIQACQPIDAKLALISKNLLKSTLNIPSEQTPPSRTQLLSAARPARPTCYPLHATRGPHPGNTHARIHRHAHIDAHTQREKYIWTEEKERHERT